MSRSFALALVLVPACVVSGCHGSSPRSTSTVSEQSAPPAKNAALASAFQASHGTFDFFPRRVGVASCVISGGGPAPGLRVHGRCSTKVSFASGRYSGRAVVVFTESWPWRSFHHSGSPRPVQHHSWSFVVLPSHKVISLGETGDFPPQDAR